MTGDDESSVRPVTRRAALAATAGALGAVAGCATGPFSGNESPTSTSGDVTVAVETVVEPVAEPWSLAPLPDGTRLLVTERGGRLRVIDVADGTIQTVTGTPSVYAQGQGGLLDIALHPSFPDARWVYLTYSASDGNGRSATHLGRGRLGQDGESLQDFEQLHVAEPFVESSGHFGSRVAFGPDGFVYQTVGDRQFKDFGPDHTAQDLSTEHGVTLRLAPDGSVPDDNPFVDRAGARDAIYSYGHRNAQGLTVHPDTGALWESEFGEKAGDELNIVEAGANYGWPVADEGCRYGTDDPVGVSHSEREDVVAPVYSWPCGSGGFPPSGMTFYTGAAFPSWQGDLFVGGLASQYLARLTVDGRSVTEAEPLLADRGWRIRDVVPAPESGHLYVAVDDTDAPIVRLRPV
ncbi:PQQ-dependent sugar dehydrogenase [Halorientalis salina]|uniref:PQQ-dependent sugar dehydrogenase n=1 Tax=Halorientalis salina TaxID=2932266 RepID=UPI0010AD2732|nr:PQQ-dependent sugar dehydrogenase [Halorientalis salina]